MDALCAGNLLQAPCNSLCPIRRCTAVGQLRSSARSPPYTCAGHGYRDDANTSTRAGRASLKQYGHQVWCLRAKIITCDSCMQRL